MKLYFMKQDAVDFMKHNMERLYTHYFQDETNEWMAREYGSDPFSEFMEVPDFELAEIDAMSIGEADFENCKILYNNLRSLSESQCSDERLWAGLCNSTFYGYMRRRYQYPSKQLKKKETDASAVISRFFFSGGTRTGFFRNGLAKCWWVGHATFDKDNENHFACLDVIGSNDLTTKISDIFYSNSFSSNPTILYGICDALKYFSDRGQALDEKKHLRASMQYLNAVGGATLLDVLTREEICKLMTSRIICILKGQSADISFDDEDDDLLLEEIIEEDDYENSTDADIEVASKSGERANFFTIEDEVSEQQNWIEEVEESTDLPAPDYITYGCWVRILDEKNQKEILYHIPLKNDHSRTWYRIEEIVLGQTVGFSVFLAGRDYRVVEFGRDDDRDDTRPEFIEKEAESVDQGEKRKPFELAEEKEQGNVPKVPVEEPVTTDSEEEHDFYNWLRQEGFMERVIDRFKGYIKENHLFEIKDEEELQRFIENRKSICSFNERTLYKYYMEYWKQSH